jgi:hypothetical protein
MPGNEIKKEKGKKKKKKQNVYKSETRVVSEHIQIRFRFA